MSRARSKLLVFSYYSGFPARVTSEWVEDRIRVAQEQGLKLSLITSPQSRLRSSKELRVLRIPSLSFQDFRYELKEMRGNRGKIGSDFLWVFPWLLVSITLGSLFDLVFRLLAGARSSGMYSWAGTASIVALALQAFKKADRIYATGGPSSAQIAGTLTGVISRTPSYLEFQDPFIGSEMHVTRSASSVLQVLERFFVKNATQITVVTEKAGADLRARYPDSSRKIRAEHPGSWDFGIRGSKSGGQSRGGDCFVITHLGTLYGKRNLDTLFEAIGLLPDGIRRRIRVTSIGGVFVDKADEYRSQSFFSEVGYLPRVDSLKLAAESDLLLLVQHTDSRSEETIPYKTYDYLNLGLPIFALVNNPELEHLIQSHGGMVADVKSPKDISQKLETIMTGSGSSQNIAKTPPNVKETFLHLVGLEIT